MLELPEIAVFPLTLISALSIVSVAPPLIYIPEPLSEITVSFGVPVITVSYLPQNIVEPDVDLNVEFLATRILRPFIPLFFITLSLCSQSPFTVSVFEEAS